MLDRLLQIIGIDLDAKFAQVKAQVDAFKDTAKHELQAELVHAGTVAGFALAAFVALTATCVIALVGLYIWLKPQLGELNALAVVGAVTAVIAIVMAALATTRKKSPIPATEPVVVPETIVAVSRPV